jgi:polyisoprenoid-binding protein YceI
MSKLCTVAILASYPGFASVVVSANRAVAVQNDDANGPKPAPMGWPSGCNGVVTYGSRKTRGEIAMALKQWKIDATHSSITFLVRHMLVSRIHGSFARWSGDVRFSEAIPAAASVTALIEAASIDTREPKRDAHLRSGDFLDVERFPFIDFRSTSVETFHGGGGRNFVVTGDFTMRGVTREVQLEVEYGGRVRDPSGAERIGFTARVTISRKAYGITFNQVLESGGLALGDKLELRFDISAVEVARASSLGGGAEVGRRQAAIAYV